jgi:hypothetical protein
MAIGANFDRSGDAVPAGTYEATLEEVNDTTMEWEGVAKQALEFSFKYMADEVLKSIKQKYNKTLASKGNLYKLMSGMLGNRWNKQVIDNDQMVIAAINSCIGKMYYLQLSVTEKGYNRIAAVIPIPQLQPAKLPVKKTPISATPVAAPAAAVDLTATPMDENTPADDVNF